MKTIFLSALLVSLSLLSACVYKPTIQQGNILEQSEVNKIKPGMTKDQISYVLGNPALNTNLDSDTWYYLYYMVPSKGDRREERLILHFNGEVLQSMEGTIKPEAEE
ncbi:outer membrane protein assembly factor BamE [Kangiella koreensis]|uniref:Outer membrane protein assembly factor BamE n=1 Tax=Kangiella koreensis (strain DSM 16069 / JCM 12317 / KCTC 12182 / SW-125) TaxID=523791 RepID=C7R965_KANKD|nr:outer membrane protein assembly factor BamE [Kangiella koreensis]ACV27855.1 SmpA/OmlA domain protein [Kangiella koreensis DSM 16069]